MTISELIRELKKYPPDSYIGILHPSDDEHDLPVIVRTVCDFDPKECEDKSAAKDIYVVLST